MTPGRVYWITGLSGTGKTTLANALREKLPNAVMLDGDDIREMMELTGYDRDSRLSIARFNARLCRFLSAQGVDVICATISLFHDVQRWNRAHIANYCEIFLEAPISVLEQRDTKDIYRRAHTGELPHVWGIGLKAETPERPDFTFVTDGSIAISDMVHTILSPHKRSARA